ncbi:MAG: hypothetical protein ACRDZW_00385, partial [Acidimicrobiales bacterium]
MKRAALLVACLALLGVGAGCTREPRLAGDTARLTLADGARAEAGERGRDLRAVKGVTVFHDGARVRLLGGEADLALAGGAMLGLRQGSEIVVGRRPTLVSGMVLVVPSDPTPLVIRAGDATVTALGPARVERDLAVSAASYRSGLRMASAGRRLLVPALRQATVASLGEVPADPEPLDYDDGNAWDRRYLGAAVQLGSELEARSRGFSASLRRGAGHTPGFYRLLLPALESEPGFDTVALPEEQPPGETLVGTTLALAGRRGSFATRYSEVFAFRAEGANWGLVALDQGVDQAPVPVVETVDVAIGRAPLAFAPPPSTETASAPDPSPAPRSSDRPT